LKITNIFGGVGRIELFIFAESGTHFLYEGAIEYQVGTASVYGGGVEFQVSTASAVKANELIDICPAISELLGEECFLQAFKYEGELNFEGDIFQEISVGEIIPWEWTPLLDEQDLYKMLENSNSSATNCH